MKCFDSRLLPATAHVVNDVKHTAYIVLAVLLCELLCRMLEEGLKVPTYGLPHLAAR